MTFEYEKELVKQLEKDRWLRHLFNKIGKEVVISLRSGEHLIGILKTIQYIRGVINLEIEGSSVFFVNWRYVQYLEVRK